MLWPSGDQAGVRSAAPDVRVRLRMSPFSEGTVKISPRASNTARTPLGESAAMRIRSPTLSQCGRAQGKSPAAVIVSFLGSPTFGSRVYR